LKQALDTWRPQAGYAAGLLLTSLNEKSHQWWYFLDHPEVAPDNNLAERSLRLGVTKRKVSGDCHSILSRSGSFCFGIFSRSFSFC
jgi:transposase